MCLDYCILWIPGSKKHLSSHKIAAKLPHAAGSLLNLSYSTPKFRAPIQTAALPSSGRSFHSIHWSIKRIGETLENPNLPCRIMKSTRFKRLHFLRKFCHPQKSLVMLAIGWVTQWHFSTFWKTNHSKFWEKKQPSNVKVGKVAVSWEKESFGQGCRLSTYAA